MAGSGVEVSLAIAGEATSLSFGRCDSGIARSRSTNVTSGPLKLSVKSDYAARAVMGLSRRYPTGAAVKVEELAAENGIPPKYLVQILIELKSRHIVKSVRGKEGGYLLARPPGEITFGDVLRSVHGRIFDPPALGSGGAHRECPPELRSAWERLQAALDDAANAITFQRLLEESHDKEKMYYI
jgi:Rrf2 family protein